MQLSHRYIQLPSVTLHTVSAGDDGAPLVILLHGFPEYWVGWKNQLPALAGAGYHLLAPDQRGYNLSSKPRDLAAYNLDQLTGDVVGLIRAHGRERAFVVGHDWGAAVAWWTAIKFPQVVEKLVVLNVPHPTVMRRFATESLEQQMRSWYIAFFQIPWLPEFLMRLNNWQAARRMMRASSHPHTFSDEDMQMYVRAWSRPHAMRSMINWYRAVLRTKMARLPDVRVRRPTRIIWGVQDIALSRELAPRSLEMCDQGDLHFIESATHWVQHDAPERVNQLILEFIQSR